jgi:hypothetical protein
MKTAVENPTVVRALGDGTFSIGVIVFGTGELWFTCPLYKRWRWGPLPPNSRVAPDQGIQEVDFGLLDQVHWRSTPTGGECNSNPVRLAQLELIVLEEGTVSRARRHVSKLHRIKHSYDFNHDRRGMGVDDDSDMGREGTVASSRPSPRR